ncbi:MAG TPA: helix-turn-helix transcriptional regulator, partial [Candidatus Limnocylindrales bacterium]
MDTVRFGRQLRALRRHRGLRQDDVARCAGLSRSVVARAEQGGADRIQPRSLVRIANALGARFVGRLDWNGEALDRL